MKYSIMSIFAVITSVHAGSVADYVQECPGESQDFDVSLEFSGGTSYHATCPHSYARCPFGDWSDPSKCLGNPTDWTSEGGRSFDYLETHQFRQKNGKPKYIRVDDKKGEYSCARVFYQDQFFDFPLGKERGLDIKEWWDGREESTYEPLQMSIIPFNPSNGSGCSGGSIDDFNAERLVAIWISPYGGQETDPNDASSVYCDLSVNPEDCLNLPYWGVESKSWGDELVLHGTLSNVLQEGKDVDIFLPEGYDLNMPINNIQLRFQIAAGSTDACKDYINGGQSTCMINKLYRTAEGTEAKVTVSGLGRINGWDAMKTQREQNFYLNINNPYQFSNAGSGDSSDPGQVLNDASLNWEAFAQWFISGQLLSLSSEKTGYEYGNGVFALDVSGVEVSWGSKYGFSPINLNAVDESTFNHPTKIFDVKYVGTFNDQADCLDLRATGSYTDQTYTQSNDDNIKIWAEQSSRRHSTILQGKAGCGINLSSYGYGEIEGSSITGVYAHRITHAKSDNWNGCGEGMQPGGEGYGGLICSRSCALASNSKGLVDTEISGLYVPEILDANSISRVFALGVNKQGYFCGADSRPSSDFVTKYPIQNIVLKNSAIYPEPGCMSSIFDDAGIIEWGNPSITFFDESSSNTKICDFEGALSMHENPSYFVCGFSEQADAEKYCMTTNGVGSAINVEYNIVNGANPNINFPTCGFGKATATE